MHDKRTRRRRLIDRGMTLVEILIVCALIGLVTGGIVAGTQQLPSARLKRTATMLASAVKVAFTRATATSRHLRIVMDLDTSSMWIEESDRPMLVQSKDKTGTAGADPITVAEQQAVADGESIVKGPPVPKPHFHPIEAYGFGEGEVAGDGAAKGAKPLQRGITFREVQSAHDDEPRTKGRAYLYFWPGGLTERASIALRIGDSVNDKNVLTLVVSPLTGKVTVKSGLVALAKPVDDKEASEREDTGF
jgi:general secretion pathway protein H